MPSCCRTITRPVLTALGNVEDALVAVQQTADQELRQQDAADKARRAFEFAQLQFQAGTTNILTMLQYRDRAVHGAGRAGAGRNSRTLRRCSISIRRSAAAGICTPAQPTRQEQAP